MSDNKELDEIFLQLQKLGSKELVLEKSYSIITKRYQAKRLHTFWVAFRYFGLGSKQLWDRQGFMDCVHQNKLLKALLLGSGQFGESDIKPAWTPYWGISPHQYLKVRIDAGKSVRLDPWSSKYGIEFGDYARWFHTKTKRIL